jgi:long-chain fatty acid transport protein
MASTATPVDAIGALYWNPAAIGQLDHSEVAVGAAFIIPDIHLDSTAPGPLGLRSGRTRSDSGVAPASSLGFVYKPDDGPLTYGLGLSSVAAGGVNFPGDVTNPILAGVGPLGNVQGPIEASLLILQVTPTVAYKVTDRLTVGGGPVVDIAATSFDPAYFGAPDDANGDGIGMFPSGAHSRPFWGGGVRAGFDFAVTDQVTVGFGYTSPQWFEVWKYYARTELGLPRTLLLNATLPAIYSWGVSYRPIDKLLLAADLRYLDYASTELFGTPIKDGGLGWKSVFAAAFGARYQLTDRLAASAGYVYNENPIPSVGTLFNLQAPLITQHTITLATTMALTDAMSVSLGYAYAFHNTLTGPVREATGVGVTMESAAHLLNLTFQFKFGGCGCSHPAVACEDHGCAPAAPAAAGPAAAPAVRLPDSRIGG